MVRIEVVEIKKHIYYVGFEIFTVANIFRDMTPCSLVEVHQSFGWTY
jgi:hypothetical protein